MTSGGWCRSAAITPARCACWCAAARTISTWRWISAAGRAGPTAASPALEILFCALDDFGVARLLEATPRVLAVLRPVLASHRLRPGSILSGGLRRFRSGGRLL